MPVGVSMTYSTRNKKNSFLGMTGVNLITDGKQKHLGLNSAGTWDPDVNGVTESAHVVDTSSRNRH
jgi:hypothetical protein